MEHPSDVFSISEALTERVLLPLKQAFTAEDVRRWYRDSAAALPAPWVASLAANFKSNFPKDAAPYMAEQGWAATDMLRYSNLASEYAPGLQWTAHLGLRNNSDPQAGKEGVPLDDHNLYIDASLEHEKYIEAVIQ
jgi:hypothetical protein